MSVQQCPFCGEDKPADGLTGHVMLSSDGGHGPFGKVPVDFDRLERAAKPAEPDRFTDPDVGEPEDDHDVTPIQDVEARTPSPARRVAAHVLYVVNSVSLSMAIVGAVLVVVAATTLGGAPAAITGLLGGLTVIVCLGLFVSVHLLQHLRR